MELIEHQPGWSRWINNPSDDILAVSMSDDLQIVRFANRTIRAMTWSIKDIYSFMVNS